MRQLRTFHRAAALLSFSRAAAELNYAQSSVTGQIKGLENALGVALFERLSGRKVRLTPAGWRLMPYAERLLLLADEARNAASGSPEPSGRLVIGTMESIATYRMPPLLEFFHHRYPRVRLSLRTTIGDETRQALRQGTYDLGFLMEEATEHPGLESVVLCEEPLALVAAPRHALAGREFGITDLVRQSLLATEPGCAYRDLFERELKSSGEPVDFMEFGTIEATKRAAAAGLGVSLLPEVTVAAELAQGSLVRLPWQPPFTLRTQLAWRAGKRLPAHVRLFLEQARKLVSEEAGQA